jgi:small subunit ribosomal protein S7
MSRRAAAPHRTILPDPKFGNDMLAKFINMVMERGKKSAAEKIVYGAIDRIGDKSGRAGGEAIAVCSRRSTTSSPWSR